MEANISALHLLDARTTLSGSSESDYIRICDAIASNPNLLVLDTYYYTTDTLLQMNDDFNVLQWLSMLFVLIVLLVSFHFQPEAHSAGLHAYTSQLVDSIGSNGHIQCQFQFDKHHHINVYFRYRSRL